jgi:acetolactate synthase-1/2/3 large subunit
VPIVGNVTDVIDEILKLIDGGFKADRKWLTGGSRSTNGVVGIRWPIVRASTSCRNTWSRAVRSDGDAFITSMSASTRCLPPSTTSSTSRVAGSIPVALAPWASVAYGMGVLLANPGSQVACVTGEGSIQMCIQELSTCKQYELPVKIINLNNGMLGMVRQWQEMFYSKRYSQSYVTSLPDFVKLAESYGHVGMRIEKPEDVEPALQGLYEYKDRLVFMDFIIDPGANVFRWWRQARA